MIDVDAYFDLRAPANSDDAGVLDEMRCEQSIRISPTSSYSTRLQIPTRPWPSEDSRRVCRQPSVLSCAMMYLTKGE